MGVTMGGFRRIVIALADILAIIFRKREIDL